MSTFVSVHRLWKGEDAGQILVLGQGRQASGGVLVDGAGKADMGKRDGGQEFAERHGVDAFEVAGSEREDVFVHGWGSSKRRAGSPENLTRRVTHRRRGPAGDRGDVSQEQQPPSEGDRFHTHYPNRGSLWRRW